MQRVTVCNKDTLYDQLVDCLCGVAVTLISLNLAGNGV